MAFFLKYPNLSRNLLVILVIPAITFSFSPFLEGEKYRIRADEISPSLTSGKTPELIISQDSALISASSPNNPEPKVVQRIGAVITAYSSTPFQTDSDPFTTAANTQVRDGIIANNYLPFGTKVRLPELFGDKIFVVEDRMSWKKGNYQFDIWFPDYRQALNFGAKRTYIEILGS